MESTFQSGMLAPPRISECHPDNDLVTGYGRGGAHFSPIPAAVTIPCRSGTDGQFTVAGSDIPANIPAWNLASRMQVCGE